MMRDDKEEFELILGNRQLINVFIIFVVLLTLCFLMGYVVGRTTEPQSEVSGVDIPAQKNSAGIEVIGFGHCLDEFCYVVEEGGKSLVYKRDRSALSCWRRRNR